MKEDYEMKTAKTCDCFNTYMREILKYPLLSREEESEIVEQVRRNKDKEATEKLVLANLRLVVKMAIGYSNYQANLTDLIQEGNMGLLRAVQMYDPEKGTRFGNYALFWIRAYILKYLMDSWSIVKLGAKDSERKLFYNLKKEKEKLERDGVATSPQLLASCLDVKTSDIEGMEMRLCNRDVSLETPLYEGGENLMDTLGSDDDVEDMLTEKEWKDALQEELSEFRKSLNEKECFILDYRILAEDPLTLREVGEHFKISKERIRQAEIKISKKLTNTLKSSEIRP